MKEVIVEIKNENGLHARPASLLAQTASKWKSRIKIIKDGREYESKSIVAVLSMCAAKGEKLRIIATGSDEVEAVEALQTLAENNFGE